ncbi:bile acid:sodium symporter family protein [Bacterioplanoides sp.]|uniref:bile acid:sodium symporter family protein n=1 Tax=Bacterioplanoides sp. TaxID=2066072 RepID=UPI003B0060AA
MESLIFTALLMVQFTIMFSLGIGLEVADFKRVAERRFVFFVAVACQVILLPLVAFGSAHLFGLAPVLAAGIMLLSFCPGGVTSNIISKLSRADVALSVSLTAVVSILSFITIPPLTAISIEYFMGSAAPDFSFLRLAVITFLITTTPVMLGVFIRHHKPAVVKKIETPLERTAIALWIIIVFLAIAKSWNILVDNFVEMGTSMLLLPFVMLMIGLVIGVLLKLTRKESKTISIETGIQNSPMAITLAAAISGSELGITELALPAALYSITMYLVVIPFIFVYRKWQDDADKVAQTA